MKKNTEEIENWEQGLSFPTYPQLEKLAYKVYRRPTALFFFPAIPQESSRKAEFRTLPEEVVDTMPPGIIKLYKKAKVYQLNLSELNSQNNPMNPLLVNNFKLSKTLNIIELAKAIRDFLKIDLQTQAE